MEIKKGDRFYCKKAVVMESGERAYTKGEVYLSEEDDCITDDQGYELHYWNKESTAIVNRYFTKVEQDTRKHINPKYITLVDKILKEGYEYEDPKRKGVIRKQISSYTLIHDFEDGFPIITAKRTFPKTAIKELHFFMKGEEDIREYWKKGFNIWNEDWKRYWQNNPVSENQEMEKKEFFKLKNTYPSYIPNQMRSVFRLLESNPMHTKKKVSMWDIDKNRDTVLSPCHWAFEVLVEPIEEEDFEYGLRIKWHQDSVDTFLGLPMNILYYSFMCVWLAGKFNFKPLGVIGDLSNVHLYDNTFTKAQDMVERYLVGGVRDEHLEVSYKNYILGLRYPEIEEFNLPENYEKGKHVKAKMLTYG